MLLTFNLSIYHLMGIIILGIILIILSNIFSSIVINKNGVSFLKKNKENEINFCQNHFCNKYKFSDIVLKVMNYITRLEHIENIETLKFQMEFAEESFKKMFQKMTEIYLCTASKRNGEVQEKIATTTKFLYFRMVVNDILDNMKIECRKDLKQDKESLKQTDLNKYNQYKNNKIEYITQLMKTAVPTPLISEMGFYSEFMDRIRSEFVPFLTEEVNKILDHSREVFINKEIEKNEIILKLNIFCKQVTNENDFFTNLII